MKKFTYLIVSLFAGLFLVTGCSTVSDADMTSENLSRAADQFEIERRIVFLNGITDTYLLEIQGLCSLTDQGSQLEVICKTGEDEYKKHFLGLSDNVTYFAEQTEAAFADPYHYRVIFKPETIVPYIDLETSVDIEGDN